MTRTLKNKAYLAGPMRGYPRYNFDRFEQAAIELESYDIRVTSPHRLDLDTGFNPDTDGDFTGASMEEAVRRDVNAIIESDAIVLLEGWEKSKGATAEKAVAEWLERKVYEIEELLSWLKFYRSES